MRFRAASIATIAFLAAVAVLFAVAAARGGGVGAAVFGGSVPRGVPSTSSCDAACAVFSEPEAGIAPFMALVRGASSSLDLVMYELEDPAVFAALADAAHRGVAVRVILNRRFYSPRGASFVRGNPNEMAYAALMRADIPVRWAPLGFTYTHEKAMAVDGTRLLVMSFNLVPKYYPTGRDFGVIDEDPADVAAMEAVFDDDWHGAAGKSGASAAPGDALVWSPGSRGALVGMIATASRTLEVYNEEMADEKVAAALAAAARRGVMVRIVMTWAAEWVPAWRMLAAAGAQVRTYPAAANGRYIHAKMIVADGVRAFVGSENFSATSLEENRELGVMLAVPRGIGVLRAAFEGDWNAAQPFTRRGG